MSGRPVELLAQILAEILLQLVGEIVVEVLFGLGDPATGGRMLRVVSFAVAGLALGALSVLVRPSHLVGSAVGRYAAVGVLTVVGGLFLAWVESRVRRGGRGAAAAGFLSGAAFGLAYAWARHLAL